MNKKIVAFIPVRGGSKSIPLKNIRNFCGKPLVYWSVKAAAECQLIDEVYVSTDSDVIKREVENFGMDKVFVIPRSAESACDEAKTETAMLEFALSCDFSDIILIQATSPLLESEDLSGGVGRYIESGATSLLSVVRQKRFIWRVSDDKAEPVNYNPGNRPRRQEWDGFFVENGAFYITSKEALLLSRCRISGKTSLYEMPEDTYFEIDELSDWIIAENLKRERMQNDKKDVIDLSKINLLICDVDGVLTDAGMYYSTDGVELKKFNARDGKGIELLRNSGIKVMLMTSEDNDIIRNRARKLNIDFLFTGIKDKKAQIINFFSQHPEFSFAGTAYIGDDVNDLDAMNEVYFSAAPSDADENVKLKSSYRCIRRGGDGCVREVCDIILNKRCGA